MTRISAFVAVLSAAFWLAGDAPGADLNLAHETSFVVFPQDCNANPPMLFGGKLLAEMDRCAGVATRRLLYSSKVKDAVTAGLKVEFHKPGRVKDLVFVSARVTELGKKSIRIAVRAEREVEGGRELLAEGKFVFVAYDLAAGVAAEHGLTFPK